MSLFSAPKLSFDKRLQYLTNDYIGSYEFYADKFPNLDEYSLRRMEIYTKVKDPNELQNALNKLKNEKWDEHFQIQKFISSLNIEE
jgi:hypothetical protein